MRYRLFLAMLMLPCTLSAQAPAANSCPRGFPTAAEIATWRARVEAAQAMADSALMRDSMFVLAREALPGMDVHMAGNTSSTRIMKADYAPAPVINFDVNLGLKRNADTSYFFSDKDTAYVVIGPGSLHPRGHITTENNAQHEMYHAEHHLGDSRPTMDREVEVWTHVFTTTFHDTYPHKMLWSPLVTSYQNASPAEQQVTLYQLVNYYNATSLPGVPDECVAPAHAEFTAWIQRRMKDDKTANMQLIRDLQQKLKIAPVPTDAGDKK